MTRDGWRLFFLTTFLGWALKLSRYGDDAHARRDLASAQIKYIRQWGRRAHTKPRHDGEIDF